VVAFGGDVVLQGLVDVVMGYVIKHKEILDQADNQSYELSVIFIKLANLTCSIK